MEKLKQLIAKCKASVTVSVNPHKDVHESVAQYIGQCISDEDKEDIPADVFAEMIKQDTIVNVHFYPNTPVGFYSIYHFDVEKALDLALDTFNLE